MYTRHGDFSNSHFVGRRTSGSAQTAVTTPGLERVVDELAAACAVVQSGRDDALTTDATGGVERAVVAAAAPGLNDFASAAELTQGVVGSASTALGGVGPALDESTTADLGVELDGFAVAALFRRRDDRLTAAAELVLRVVGSALAARSVVRLPLDDPGAAHVAAGVHHLAPTAVVGGVDDHAASAAEPPARVVRRPSAALGVGRARLDHVHAADLGRRVEGPAGAAVRCRRNHRLSAAAELCLGVVGRAVAALGVGRAVSNASVAADLASWVVP